VWVLLWICSWYDNGAEIEHPPFYQFITSDFEQCYEKKLACRKIISRIKPTEWYQDYWRAALKLVVHVLNQRSAAEDVVIFQGAPRHEPTIDEVVHDYQDLLKQDDFEL
jgi:hypothetical protein